MALSYDNYIYLAGAWASIVTAFIAAFALAFYFWQRRFKRRRLENYLKHQKEVAGIEGLTENGSGECTLKYLVFQVGLTEAELVECAFWSKHIYRVKEVDDSDRTVGIRLEYRY